MNTQVNEVKQSQQGGALNAGWWLGVLDAQVERLVECWKEDRCSRVQEWRLAGGWEEARCSDVEEWRLAKC